MLCEEINHINEIYGKQYCLLMEIHHNGVPAPQSHIDIKKRRIKHTVKAHMVILVALKIENFVDQ